MSKKVKLEELRLAFRLRMRDSQEISVWIWEEKDRERARKYAEHLAKVLGRSSIWRRFLDTLIAARWVCKRKKGADG